MRTGKGKYFGVMKEVTYCELRELYPNRGDNEQFTPIVACGLLRVAATLRKDDADGDKPNRVINSETTDGG
jgi:hypothetical protein